MARCFPYSRYPVPDAMSCGAAAAAASANSMTDKLQREREMMQKKEKKERKKEKRRQKKATHLGENETSGHGSKHGHKRKHEGHDNMGQDTRKVLTVTMELLEKSGLSEEHEAPSYSQSLHCTPESSLDSSKRLRVNLPSSPSQTRNGVFRLKLAPSSQRRDPETTPEMSMKPRVTEQQPVKRIQMDLPMANRHGEFQPHDNTVTVVKQVLAKQKNMAQRNGTCPGESRQANQQNTAKFMHRVSTDSTPKATQRIDPHSADKVVVQRANPAPTKMLHGLDNAPVKAMQRAGHIIPPEVFHGGSTQVPANLLRKATYLGQHNMEQPTLLDKLKVCSDSPVLLNKPKVCADPPALLNKPEGCVEHSALLNKPKVCADPPALLNKTKVCADSPALLNKPEVCVEPPVVKPQQVIAPYAKEEPCSLGSVLTVAPAKERHRTSSDRKTRKVEKKERKLADLFVNWEPSPIQMEDTNDDDQDWLFRCGTTPISNRTTLDGSAMCQSPEQLFLQPRAVHLPDLNLYQLPFVVPF